MLSVVDVSVPRSYHSEGFSFKDEFLTMNVQAIPVISSCAWLNLFIAR